jgi:hypothetical protein
MKNNLKKTAILALIGAALALQGANAQLTNPAGGPANGDLIFGAEVVSSGSPTGTNLEVDLGSISNFTQTATLSFANISSTDLASVLGGSGYSTSSSDFWSVVGTNSSSDVGGYYQYSSFLTLNSAPSTGYSKTSLGSTYFDITGVYSGLRTGTTGFTAAPNSNGAGGELAASNSGSYSTWELATSTTTFFGISGSGSTTFGSGDSLNLYALDTGGDGTANRNVVGTDTLLGSFTYSASKGLIFTGADVSAAPEPSTYALVFIGLATLFVFNRRRSIKS